MEKVKILLSPTKNVSFHLPKFNISSTEPVFLKESNYLVELLQNCNEDDFKRIFNASFSITEENSKRYKNWSKEPQKYPSCYLYKGEAFKFLDVQSFKQVELEYLQKHLFILSGLYGVLKPLDLIQAYRLEMQSKLPITFPTKNLYGFWSKKITDYMNSLNLKTIINLASEEYFKVIDYKRLSCEVIQPVFKEYKNQKYSIVSIFSKQARGEMVKFICKNKLQSVEELKLFNALSYSYDANLSDKFTWVFTR
ncbi:MAG: YaaA family protein [Flavobacteriia bacterium]|nr:YaaA family protein [Flavobacteriia bacterium]